MLYGIIYTSADGVERIRRFMKMSDAASFMAELHQLGIEYEVWTN